MRLACFLLLLVGLTHGAYDHLAQFTGSKPWAVFYVLRGIEGAALFAIVSVLSRSRLVAVVCAIGMVEESQTAICRVTKDMAHPAFAPLYEGLCGSPFYTIGLMALAAVGAFLIGVRRE